MNLGDRILPRFGGETFSQHTLIDFIVQQPLFGDVTYGNKLATAEFHRARIFGNPLTQQDTRDGSDSSSQEYWLNFVEQASPTNQKGKFYKLQVTEYQSPLLD